MNNKIILSLLFTFLLLVINSSAQVTVSGNVYNDVDGRTNVNGTGINAIGGVQLYAILVNNSGNVVQNAAVASGGIYSFASVSAGNYTVQISTVAGTLGTPSVSGVIPNGWRYISEDCCDNTGNDGVANGIVAVSVASTAITNINFGIAIDTDNDGIGDDVDIDDDNDGVLDITEFNACYNSQFFASGQASYTTAGYDYYVVYSFSNGYLADNSTNNYIASISPINIPNGSFLGSSMQISNITSTTLAAAKASNTYSSFNFTTANNSVNAFLDFVYLWKPSTGASYTLTYSISEDSINYTDLTTFTVGGTGGSWPTNTTTNDFTNYLLKPNNKFLQNI